MMGSAIPYDIQALFIDLDDEFWDEKMTAQEAPLVIIHIHINLAHSNTLSFISFLFQILSLLPIVLALLLYVLIYKDKDFYHSNSI